MDKKIGKFFDSVGSFFSGGDEIPWCDHDIVAVSIAITLFAFVPVLNLAWVTGIYVNLLGFKRYFSGGSLCLIFRVMNLVIGDWLSVLDYW